MENAYFDSMLPPMQKGDILGDYEILSTTVNAGGFGRIYRAHKIGDTRRVKYAVKEFCLSNEAVDVTRHTMGKYTQMEAGEVMEALKAKFFQEAKMLQSIGHRCHGNVPHIYSLPIEEGGRLFYAMDYIEGPTLREEIEAWGVVPEDLAVGLITKVGNVLHQAHGRGLVHCDISPNNIILKKESIPVLVDFGNARSFDHSLTLRCVERDENQLFARYQAAVEKAEENLGDVSPELIESIEQAGTPGFQPPRLSLVGTTTGDVYSLAATLHYILTGNRPRPRSKAMEQELRSAGVSEETIAALLRALDPPDGFTVREFLQDLAPKIIDNILEDR